jgi:hypothetical protein
MAIKYERFISPPLFLVRALILAAVPFAGMMLHRNKRVLISRKHAGKPIQRQKGADSQGNTFETLLEGSVLISHQISGMI